MRRSMKDRNSARTMGERERGGKNLIIISDSNYWHFPIPQPRLSTFFAASFHARAWIPSFSSSFPHTQFHAQFQSIVNPISAPEMNTNSHFSGDVPRATIERSWKA
jgi:hypothetical protein